MLITRKVVVMCARRFDIHDWENAEQLSDAEKAELAKEIDMAIRQGSILAGKVGGNH